MYHVVEMEDYEMGKWSESVLRFVDSVATAPSEEDDFLKLV